MILGGSGGGPQPVNDRGKNLPATVSPRPWQTLRRRMWLDAGPFLRVEAHDVRLPDGRELRDWPWIITPDYVVIAARDLAGRWLFFRQTKYAVRGEVLAPPGGYLAPDEDPPAAARRELLEETGYAAPEWSALGSYVIDANRGAGRAHLFLARAAAPASGPPPEGHDDLEEQELVLLSDAELRRALEAGRFRVLCWVALVSLALQKIANNSQGGRGPQPRSRGRRQ